MTAKIFTFVNLLWIMAVLCVAIWSYNIGTLNAMIMHADEYKNVNSLETRP